MCDFSTMCETDYDYGSEFQCSDGLLVGCNFFCDGYSDCAEGEDEKECKFWFGGHAAHDTIHTTTQQQGIILHFGQ